MDGSKVGLGRKLAGVSLIGVAVCIAIAVSGAGTVAHANSIPACTNGGGVPCTLGNLEVVSTGTGTLFNGGSLHLGCGGNGFGTFTSLNSDPLNPGYSLGTSPPCVTTKVGTGGGSGTLQLEALNGFRFGDLSGSVNCGVAGGDAFSVTFISNLAGVNPIMLNCPAESKGVAGTLSGDVTFAPVTGLTETVTLALTGVSGGSATLIGFSNNFSLIPPESTVPEPGTLLLIGTGLCGLAGLARRRLII